MIDVLYDRYVWNSESLEAEYGERLFYTYLSLIFVGEDRTFEGLPTEIKPLELEKLDSVRLYGYSNRFPLALPHWSEFTPDDSRLGMMESSDMLPGESMGDYVARQLAALRVQCADAMLDPDECMKSYPRHFGTG